MVEFGETEYPYTQVTRSKFLPIGRQQGTGEASLPAGLLMFRKAVLGRWNLYCMYATHIAAEDHRKQPTLGFIPQGNNACWAEALKDILFCFEGWGRLGS